MQALWVSSNEMFKSIGSGIMSRVFKVVEQMHKYKKVRDQERQNNIALGCKLLTVNMNKNR